MKTSVLLLVMASLLNPAFAQTPAPNPKAEEKPAAEVTLNSASDAKAPRAQDGTKEPAKQPAKENDPFEMLQQAYYAGGQLPADEHAYQMGALVIIASKIHHPMLRQWVHETLQLTQGLPQRGTRTPTEQGALSALAEADPAEALQMLIQLPPPTVTGFQALSVLPDSRTGATRSIFPKYWKGTKAPDGEALRSAANYLGETGEYPFGALALILTDVNAKDTSLAQMLFLDAVQYYKRDQPRSFEFHAQFIELLKKGMT